MKKNIPKNEKDNRIILIPMKTNMSPWKLRLEDVFPTEIVPV